MKTIDRLIFKTGSKEELLPGYSEQFQHIASRVALDKYVERCVPWHWHNTLELFYIESGALEYFTPGGSRIFHEGSGGLVNSNVLHMTKLLPNTNYNIQLVHLFDPVLISGEKGNLIDLKYVMPFINSQVELISFPADRLECKEVLKLIKDSFLLKKNEKGYELRLREKLSKIWLKMLEMEDDAMAEKTAYHKSNDQIKQMMMYVQEHFAEKISISQLAEVSFLSERGCYRVFQECLHMTPADYIKSYRLQIACQMLLKTDLNLTEISQACGLGSGSYFGKTFKENIGCTPMEYRQKWQNSDA